MNSSSPARFADRLRSSLVARRDRAELASGRSLGHVVEVSSDGDITDTFAPLSYRSTGLRERLAAATEADQGSGTARQASIDASLALIVALVDELEDEQAEAELAALVPLVRGDRRLEIETRWRLAIELVEVHDRERAIVQLRAASELARGTNRETELAIALGDLLRDDARHSDARLVLDRVAPAASPEIAAQLALSRAALAEGDAAAELCRSAVEHADKTTDLALQHRATVALAELLAARGELIDAEALLEGLPPLDDALETRALLEEIWRRLGSHLVDEEEDPDQLGEIDRALAIYLTKPRSLAQALVDGALASPSRIREWSYGELREPADLESQLIFGPVRSFWCACGRVYAGIVCRRCGVELIHAVTRRTRAGHLALAQPVVHPWYADAATQLLGRKIEDAGELRDALNDLYLDGLVEELKHEITSAPKVKTRNAAGQRLALAEAFRTAYTTPANTRPEDIVLTLLPVVPPHGDLGCDREAVRAVYAQLLEGADPTSSVRALFDVLATRRA